ncbi:calcium-binding protein, partial [Microvirga sp. CF3016]|uniref:calcium-binding protein n=1 Tax=Microvirga sp. CF3016 TaxID=3110181 RepID=UPI002EB53B8E|nr:hypothetical protein [Microvirga sp. CF3016]
MATNELSTLEWEYLRYAAIWGVPLLGYGEGDDGGGGPGGSTDGGGTGGTDGGTGTGGSGTGDGGSGIPADLPTEMTVAGRDYDVIPVGKRVYLVIKGTEEGRTVLEMTVDANGERSYDVVTSDFWDKYRIVSDRPDGGTGGGRPDGGTGGGTPDGGTGGGTPDGGTGGSTPDGGASTEIRHISTLVQIATGYLVLKTTIGTAGNDVFQGEGELIAGDGDDDVTASAKADFVIGGAGQDTLRGMDGDDRLFGGAGHDVLNGGAGDDLLYGGAGVNRLVGGEGFD